MISDNATTYTAAANHLRKLFNSPAVLEALSRKGTEWRFIPARAPWYGGFWERLIGLTKTSLEKILGRRFVSMETLQTIVTEIEAVLNDRPLTHVSSNLHDLEPLTPSHLLYGRKMTSLPYTEHYTDDDVTVVQSDQTTLTHPSRTQANIVSSGNVGDPSTSRHYESTIKLRDRGRSVSALETSCRSTTRDHAAVGA